MEEVSQCHARVRQQEAASTCRISDAAVASAELRTRVEELEGNLAEAREEAVRQQELQQEHGEAFRRKAVSATEERDELSARLADMQSELVHELGLRDRLEEAKQQLVALTRERDVLYEQDVELEDNARRHQSLLQEVRLMQRKVQHFAEDEDALREEAAEAEEEARRQQGMRQRLIESARAEAAEASEERESLLQRVAMAEHEAQEELDLRRELECEWQEALHAIDEQRGVLQQAEEEQEWHLATTDLPAAPRRDHVAAVAAGILAKSTAMAVEVALTEDARKEGDGALRAQASLREEVVEAEAHVQEQLSVRKRLEDAWRRSLRSRGNQVGAEPHSEPRGGPLFVMKDRHRGRLESRLRNGDLRRQTRESSESARASLQLLAYGPSSADHAPLRPSSAPRRPQRPRTRSPMRVGTSLLGAASATWSSSSHRSPDRAQVAAMALDTQLQTIERRSPLKSRESAASALRQALRLAPQA